VAEIRVDRKHSTLWMWIAGLVLLVLMVWGLSRAHRDQTQIDTGTAEVDMSAPPQPPVRLPVA
jgi:hypothetical protein